MADLNPCKAMADSAEEDLRTAFEERAAFLEFDGGLTRADAEAEAAEEMGRRRPEPEPGGD